MKRSLTRFLALALTLTLALSTVAAVFAAGAAGDMDADGKHTAADARIVLRIAVGLESAAAYVNSADIDGDGKATAADARIVLRIAVGLEKAADYDRPAPADMPETKAEIADFYKAAVRRVKNGDAGYTKKEWQDLGDLNVTGIGMVDNLIRNVAAGYFRDENSAEPTVNQKGSEEAKVRMNDFTLTDYSKIVSATCEPTADGNYAIALTFAEEDTPHRGSSFLAQVGSVLLWEDIEPELNSISALSEYQNIHVRYTDYTITATLTPDGEFLALRHHCDIAIDIGSATILVVTLRDKTVTMENTVLYTDWTY